MASVQTDVRRLTQQVDRLADVIASTRKLEYRYQKLVAETVMLRLFYLLETAVESAALKLSCGVPYGDGVAPVLLWAPPRSIRGAESRILGARRGRSVYLKWTTLKDVQDNLRTALAPSEHFLQHRATHDGVYESMRHVRNHIAHNTRSTAAKFSPVVHLIYGGARRGVSPAKLLLTQRIAIPGMSVPVRITVLDQYLSWSKTFFKTLCRA